MPSLERVYQLDPRRLCEKEREREPPRPGRGGPKKEKAFPTGRATGPKKPGRAGQGPHTSGTGRCGPPGNCRLKFCRLSFICPNRACVRATMHMAPIPVRRAGDTLWVGTHTPKQCRPSSSTCTRVQIPRGHGKCAKKAGTSTDEHAERQMTIGDGPSEAWDAKIELQCTYL